MTPESVGSLTDVRLDDDQRGLTLCMYDGIAALPPHLPPHLGDEGTVTRHLRFADAVPASCLYALMLGALRRVFEANAKLGDFAANGGELEQVRAVWTESLSAQEDCDRLAALADWCAATD